MRIYIVCRRKRAWIGSTHLGRGNLERITRKAITWNLAQVNDGVEGQKFFGGGDKERRTELGEVEEGGPESETCC